MENYFWVKWKYPNETFIRFDLYLVDTNYNETQIMIKPFDDFKKIIDKSWIIDIIKVNCPF